MREYRFDNDTISEVTNLVKYHDFFIEPSRKSIKKILSEFGKDFALKLLDIRKQDMLAQNPILAVERLKKNDGIKATILEILEKQEAFSLKDLFISGKDLIDIGFSQGRIIGDCLNFLLENVIEYPENNKREILLEMGKEFYAKRN